MDKKRLKMFHDRLVTERAALRGVVGRNEDYGHEADIEATQDPADKASNSYTKELLFSQSTNDRQILMQIDEALQRIRPSWGKLAEILIFLLDAHLPPHIEGVALVDQQINRQPDGQVRAQR